MVTLQSFNGLKNNVCGETPGNNINFGVMADRSCAYFDYWDHHRHSCNIALENIILISILACTMAR